MWEPNEFWIATTHGPAKVEGLTYRGLGLHYEAHLGWRLSHLGSGHLVVGLAGEIVQAKAAATEIAELCDWSFDGARGWKNISPELPEKMQDWMNRNADRHVKRTMSGAGMNEENEEIAARVVRLRA